MSENENEIENENENEKNEKKQKQKQTKAGRRVCYHEAVLWLAPVWEPWWTTTRWGGEAEG